MYQRITDISTYRIHANDLFYSLFLLKKTVEKWNLLCRNSNVLFAFSYCGFNIVNVQQIIQSDVYKFRMYCSYCGFHILNVQYIMESTVYKFRTCFLHFIVLIWTFAMFRTTQTIKYNIKFRRKKLVFLYAFKSVFCRVTH